jgi:anti-sigma factor RsiW
MSDTWTHRLSEYLDGELAVREHDACERHLETCADCRELLAGLGAVKQRAGALMDPPAPDDLWAGIATRLGTAGSTGANGARILELRPRVAATLWPSLAAAAAVIAVTAAAVWFALGARRAAAPGTVATGGESSATSTRLATYDAAQVDGQVAALQQALERGRGKLDPKTVAVLEKNLATIRQATEDARRALAQDPANRELQDYFAATVQSKLALMRRATAMAGV